LSSTFASQVGYTDYSERSIHCPGGKFPSSGPAAGDVQHLASDKPGLLSQEKQDSGGNGCGLADPAHRRHRAALNSSHDVPRRSAVAAVISVVMKPGATELA
jgi:hypothetical protein